MPNTYVRQADGTWRNCEKLYTRAGGKWERVHGCYAWYALPGQNARWHQIFEWGEILNPPPSNFGGVAPGAGDHNSGTMSWTASTDPFVVGYTLGMYGPWGGPFDYAVNLSKETTSYTWGGMLPDSSYSFTIRSYDEFGEYGPNSNTITYRTGHAREVRTNPGWPGANGVAVRPTAVPFHNVPDGTKTFVGNQNMWLIGDETVRQGKGSDTFYGCVGVVNYSNVYDQIISQIVPAWGTNPPAGTIVVDDAWIQRIDRKKVSLSSGNIDVHWAPAAFDFSWGNAPFRTTDEITWQSPQPDGFRSDCKFLRDNGSNALIDWAEHWIREQGSGHHGIACKNDNTGGGNQDGVHYVVLRGAGYTANQWTLEVHIRFAYEHIAHLHPTWS